MRLGEGLMGSSEKNRIRILIIDDEPGLRDMAVYGLSDRGYEVMTASSGEEGIEKVKGKPYDLIVCDMRMPGKNGLETLKEIKRLNSQTEVIMAAGYPTIEGAAESKQQGASGYIAKPYGLDQLCEIFEKVLARRRRRAPGSQGTES